MTKVWDERSWYSVQRKLRDMGKDVDVVVFDPNLKEDSTHNTKFNCFGKKALDFFGLPKKELASRYQRKKYDIILIIADQPCMPIQFIASRAKGKFRVGCSKDITADLDLILIRSSEMGSKEYLNELIKYLQQINSK